MKKSAVVLVSILALVFGACSQIPGLTPTPGTGPTVDSAATSDALFKTAVAQTLTARPTQPSGAVSDTPTAVATAASPVVANTDTATAVASPVLSVSDTPAATGTLPPTVDLTMTPATATTLPGGTIATATLAAGQVTPIWTLAVRTYGTLPPAVPFSQITLINRARTEAYISLQVTMPDGEYSILEYPVEGRITIDAPVGSYLYVAWVGGRKMVGEFRLHQNDDMSITLNRDSVLVR